MLASATYAERAGKIRAFHPLITAVSAKKQRELLRPSSRSRFLGLFALRMK